MTRSAARILSLALLASAPLTGGCNYLSGANDLAVQEGRSKAKRGSEEAPQGGEGAGPVDQTTSTGTGDQPPPSETFADATGVSIQSIAIYQGVKRPLMEGGSSASTSVPVIAGREALVRVFLSLSGEYDGQPVTARLTVDGGDALEAEVTPNGNPTEGALGSTVNFNLPGDMVSTGFSYRVELLQRVGEGGGDFPAAHFPADGLAQVGAKATGAALKIVLVPIKYGADGSNRLPDTSSTQLQRYANAFYGTYPVAAVDISVHDAIQYNGDVAANGSGWDTLLNSIADFRASDGAPDDTYYYGIFAPGSSFGSYCAGGCVAGLGFIGSPNDTYTRAAIGLGFSGDVASDTAIHELGHNHGREHAPCGGAAGVDPGYPDASGSIGSWGFDLVHQQLINPADTVDMMSYCSPIWVSDYTFKGLANHLAGVSAKLNYPAEVLDRQYDRVRIDGDGNVVPMDAIELHTPPQGESRDVVVRAGGKLRTVAGSFFAYDHLEGGVLFWPRTEQAPHTVEIQVAGVKHVVAR